MSLPIPQPGPGRPKGALNYATREIKEFWHGYFSSQEYREEAKKRILSGSAPTLELYLLQLIYGKPREQVDLNISQGPEDLSSLSIGELHARAEQLVNQLAEAKALEEALPAEYRASPQGVLAMDTSGGDGAEDSSTA
jgi:hypothetical protein